MYNLIIKTMFKKIPPAYHMSGCSGGLVTTQIKKLDVNGITRVEKVLSDPKDVYPDLPAPENFSLKAQIESGVQLQEVNSNLLSPSSSDVQRASQQLETKLNSSDDE